MSENEKTRPPLVEKNPSSQLLLGLVFGIAFGFLLQKGGVAKYHVLVGVLLLRDFTVIKVMLSAILVGMIGIFALRRAGLVKLHVKPTRYAANIIGGLIFGVGFALSAYCPGTGAAALGQGNLDAIAVMVGMVVGSYLFAEASALGRPQDQPHRRARRTDVAPASTPPERARHRRLRSRDRRRAGDPLASGREVA